MIVTTPDRVDGSTAKVSALAATTTYYVTPTVGNYTPNSPNNIKLSGNCGTYIGGVIKARVIHQSGNTFAIEICKQDGTPFSSGGTARIKAGSVCGGQAGFMGYSMLNYSVIVQITATFNQGITHFYPIVESYSNGLMYFAEPIIVYTSPLYTSQPYTNGTLLGTVDGANLYATGSDNQNLTSAFQCTEFCQRYYSQVYGIAFSRNVWGDATDWMDNQDTRFEKQVNGQITPRIGDILCFGGGTTTPSKPQGYGHVAIITEVSNTEVKFAHQNGGTGGYLDAFIPIGGRVSRSGGSLYMISPTTTLYVKGIIRKKP